MTGVMLPFTFYKRSKTPSTLQQRLSSTLHYFLFFQKENIHFLYWSN